MTLPEIEFELSAHQFELMGYPPLHQGEPLDVILDAGELLPDPGADAWYTVQQSPLERQFKRVGRARYAFTGQIYAADIVRDDQVETAVVMVDCGVVRLRVGCSPLPDGRLPDGVWETRYMTGLCHVHGIVEDGYVAPIGDTTGVTIWHIRRLMLTPGDANFAEWVESDHLLPTPYRHDRVLISAHVHRAARA